MYDGHLFQISLCSHPFPVEGLLVVPISIDEVIIQQPVIVRSPPKPSHQCIDVSNLNVNHLEAAIQQCVIHVIQHFGFQSLQCKDNLVLHLSNRIIILLSSYLPFPEHCLLIDAECSSLPEELLDVFSFLQFIQNICDVG